MMYWWLPGSPIAVKSIVLVNSQGKGGIMEGKNLARPDYPWGLWRGYFTYTTRPGRHPMKLDLAFACGRILGRGIDSGGRSVLLGRYDLDSPSLEWDKAYYERERVFYRGRYNGREIHGSWSIDSSFFGGFSIWPVGLGVGDVDRSAWKELFVKQKTKKTTVYKVTIPIEEYCDNVVEVRYEPGDLLEVIEEIQPDGLVLQRRGDKYRFPILRKNIKKLHLVVVSQ